MNGGVPPPGGLPISPDVMRQRFGARLLHPSEMPSLFQMVEALCRRAHLPRLPDLYLLPDRTSMNAYALGGPEHSAITLTEGLLRRHDARRDRRHLWRTRSRISATTTAGP